MQVYIVDDDEAVRDSLELLMRSVKLEARSFSSAQEFLAVVRTLRPGCLITDVRMPEMDGLELQARLTELKLHFPIVMITGHGDVPMAVRAMRAGAVDFVEKPFLKEAILASIGLARSRLEQPVRSFQPDAASAARLSLLSPREREVLEGLVAGLPNKTIAFNLEISPRTVEIHRARVMDKMQARSLSELVRIALSAGIEVKAL